MMKVVKSGIVFLVVFFSVNTAQSQIMDSLSVIYLESNFDDALVFADSQYVGRASDRVFRLTPGSKELRIIPPQMDSWSIKPQIQSLNLFGGDTLTLDISFPFHYKIESVPYEASVYWEKVGERVLLGATPLLYTSEDPMRGMLLVTREGYEPYRISPGEEIWNYHHVDLEINNEKGDIADTYWHPEQRSGRWIDFAAGGVAIVSGILAIRYKTKANRRFDRYALSGNPELRSGFEKYDRYAAISLGTMQAGIGVLAIRFVLK